MSVAGAAEIFTDGGCIGNPGRGGWAFHISRVGAPLEDAGAVAQTTNNRMELTAIIRALQAAAGRRELADAKLVVYTDSRYVEQGINSWLPRWQANGWLTAAKKPVKNAELWRELAELAAALPVRFHWVRGHAGDARNERCHQLVHEAISRRGA